MHKNMRNDLPDNGWRICGELRPPAGNVGDLAGTSPTRPRGVVDPRTPDRSGQDCSAPLSYRPDR